MDLRSRIEDLFAREVKEYGEEYFRAFDELKSALNEGRVRAAEPDPSQPVGWRANAWVKKGILLGFRIGRIVEMAAPELSAAGADPSGLRSLCDGRLRRADLKTSALPAQDPELARVIREEAHKRLGGNLARSRGRPAVAAADSDC